MSHHAKPMWQRAVSNAFRWVTKERVDRVLDLALVPVDALRQARLRAVCLMRGHVPPRVPHPRYVDHCERCEAAIPKPYDFMHAGGAKRDGQEGDWKDAWNDYPPKGDEEPR